MHNFHPLNQNSKASISLKNIPFYLLCLLIPFENTALASIGGVFTAPLAIILIPYFVLYILLSYRSINRATSFILSFFLAFTIFSFFMLYLYSFEYDLSFLVDRGFKFLLLSIPPIIIFIAVTMFDTRTINRGVIVIFSVVFFSFVLNLLFPDFINTTSFIQNSPAHSIDRMRGFTLEASNFGFQITLAFLMFIAVKKYKLFLYAPLIFIAVLLTTSKGALAALLISIGITYAFYFKTHLSIKLVFAFIFLIISIFIVNLFLADDFSRDLEKYNSVATRSTVILTAIISLLTTPLGNGFFGYLPAFYENGMSAMSFMQNNIPFNLNYREFIQYLVVGATDGVSTKSFFFDWMIFGGIFFLYFYFKFTSRLFINFIQNRKIYEFLILIFLVICTTFFISIETRYIAAFALGFLYKSYKKS